MDIPPDVVIMTTSNLRLIKDMEFQRGVQRGRFEERANDVLPEKAPFKIGDTVEKIGGDYTFAGEIRGLVLKRSGVYRYVVEDERGLLFIFNETQLQFRREA